MPLPPRYLATKLTEPLPTTDGGTLRTIGDAVEYMNALPKHRELTKAWQHAAKLIIAREPVEAHHAAAFARAVHGCQARS